jgi:N-acetylneuraminate synthase
VLSLDVGGLKSEVGDRTEDGSPVSDLRSRISDLRPLTLLHCVSGYPTPPDQCNLAAIETLRRDFCILHSAFRIEFGWSDHSVNPAVIERAVQRWGASMIEFHLDLDGQGEEYSKGHCWLPAQIGEVIRACRRLGVPGCRSAGLSESEGDASRLPQPASARLWHADTPILPCAYTPPYSPTPALLPMDGTGLKAPVPSELPDRDWRSDPGDGLRPLKHVRATWKREG